MQAPPGGDVQIVPEDRTMGIVADIVARYGTGLDACMKILQEIQAAYGYLPCEECRFVLLTLRRACWREGVG